MLLIMVFLPMVSAVLAALCGRNGGGAGDNTPDVGHKKAFAAPGTAYWVALLSSAAELVLSVMLSCCQLRRSGSQWCFPTACT